MPSARKRRPGRTKARSWRGITITITIITGGITTIIIIGITTTTTITTIITGRTSVDDGEFANLRLMRRRSLDSQKA
jgi:hypothetical protein